MGRFVYVANFMRFLILRFDGIFSFTGAIPTAGQNKAIDIDENYAYLGEDQMGFYIVQIDDPTLPVPLSYVDTPGWCVGVKVSGPFAFVADASIIGVPDQAAVHIIRITDPFAPEIIGTYISHGGNAFNVFPVRTDFLIVADGSAGIKLLSLENPSSPSLLSSLSGIGIVRDVYYWNNYIYAACDETLRIFRCELGSAIPPDTIPPTVTTLMPSHMSYSSCRFQQIRMLIFDNTMIELSSIRLDVNGIPYTYSSPEIRITNDTLIWTPTTPFASGDIVNVELVSLTDTASNSARGLPLRFTFIIDLEPPIFTDPFPPNNSTITNLQPEISVTIIDSLSGLDISRIYVELNDIPISRFTVSENRLRFIPFSPFEPYDTVEVCIISAADRARYCGANVSPNYCWRFYTIPEPTEEDTIPPVVIVAFPPMNMYSSCPRQFVSFRIIENTMIDPYSIEIDANGVEFTFPSSAITLRSDTLTFQPPYEWDEGICRVELLSIQDTAGNEPEDLPISVTFYVDYTPPVITAPYPLPWSNVTDTVINISVTIFDSISGLSILSPQLYINEVQHTGYTITENIFQYVYRPTPTDSVVRVCIRNAQDRAWGCGPNITPEFCWAFFVTTNVKEKIEMALVIGNPFPNPFNRYSFIPVASSENVELVLSIYDIFGRLVKSEKLNGNGKWFIRLELPDDANSGLYIYRIETPTQTKSGKLLYIK